MNKNVPSNESNRKQFRIQELIKISLDESISRRYDPFFYSTPKLQTEQQAKQLYKLQEHISQQGFPEFIDSLIHHQLFLSQSARTELTSYLLSHPNIPTDLQNKVLSSDLASSLRCSWQHAHIP